MVSALTFTPINDNTKLALELLKKIETPKIKDISTSVFTCECLAKGSGSTNVLQSHSGFKQSYL